MAEANFIDLFLARCWHWDRQLKLHAPTPVSAALALNEAILIAESRNTKPLKGNTMETTIVMTEKESMQDMQAVMIQQTKSSLRFFHSPDRGGELSAWLHTFKIHKRMLDKTGCNPAHQVYQDVLIILAEHGVEVDLGKIVLDHIGEGEAEILSQIINGQDSMLINIDELLDIKSKILLFVTENQQRLKKYRDELIQLERLDAWIDAILFARQSLQAAGVELTA